MLLFFEKIKDLFFRGKVLKINKSDSVNVSDSFNLLVKDRFGNTKGIRDNTDERELTSDYNQGEVSEKYTIKQDPKKPISQQEAELRVVNRFLPVFNGPGSTQYILSPNQPIKDSPVDVLIVDPRSGTELGLQIRTSDDRPWKELASNKYFERSGNGFEIHRDAIKRAVESKLKYPIMIRRNILLLLDGWLGVRSEDLKHFRDEEKDFMEDTGFREIWFVGGIQETTVKLYP